MSRYVPEPLRETLLLAKQKARERGDSTYGQEHILLAIFGSSSAARARDVLSMLRVTENAVIAEIDKHFPPNSDGEDARLRARDDLFQILRLRRWLSESPVLDVSENEELLLAMLWDERDLTGLVLGNLGVSFERAYRAATGGQPAGVLLQRPRQVSYGERVYVRDDQFDAVLRHLPEVLPSGATFAFNKSSDDADSEWWFQAEQGIDLNRYISLAMKRAE